MLWLGVAILAGVLIGIVLFRQGEFNFGPSIDGKDWLTYKQRYVRPEGRVVDFANGGVTHTEGQGYGMMLAEFYGDRLTFDALWDWTRRNMSRDDGLLSWRWRPDPAGDGTVGRIDDPNNASDGEILIAWALSRASVKWPNSRYGDDAHKLMRLVAEKCVVQAPGGPLLLPGVDGFRRPDGTTIVNLSYWIFPAFHDFRDFEKDNSWITLAASGRRLIGEARFGPWKLPPDWLAVHPNGTVDLPPAAEFPPEFGYNALRIPLYVAWSGGAENDATLAPFVSFWQTQKVQGQPAATAMLEPSGLGPYPAMPGEVAIKVLAEAVIDHRSLRDLPWPSLTDPGESYYSSSLLLLSKAAAYDVSQ